MGRSRRAFLGTGASVLLGGCAGASVPSVPNPLGSGRGGGEGGGVPGQDPAGGGTSTVASPTPEGNATTAPTSGEADAATRRVFDGIAWFASEYGPATAEFTSLAARMRNLADGLSRQSSVSAADVTKLRGLTDRIEAVVADRLGPHFDASPSVVTETRERIDRVKTLRQRRDWDGASAVLSELRDLHATFATDAYVARTFPRDPVQGPLVRHVAGTGHVLDVAVVAYHVGADTVVRIQERTEVYPTAPPGGREVLERYRTLFGPLAPGPGGEARGEAGAYLTVTDLNGGGIMPLSVRRYRDAGAATAAVEALFDDGVTAERTTRLGEREWRRVFYRPAADVVYADLTRTGAFLVVAGPSQQPWEERPSGWLAPLKLTWLWE